MRKMIDIISKFTDTIKDFQMIGGPIQMADVVNILSLVPNVQHLAIHTYFLHGACKTLSNVQLDFKQLKTLELGNCCAEFFQAAFSGLSEGVLRELKLDTSHTFPANLLNGFLNRQKKITKLTMKNCSAVIFDSLKLESLVLWNMGVETTALSIQTKLKSLCLAYGKSIDEHQMKVLSNQLSELEELDCEVGETPVNVFVNIRQLKNLKHLKLRCSNVSHQSEIINALAQLNNTRIATLDISYFDDLTIHQIQTLATSAPKLKALDAQIYLDGEEKIEAILSAFNFVERLHLRCTTLMDNYDTYESYAKQRDSFNANLIELSFSFVSTHNTMFPRQMIADYPNLKKLKIESEEPLASSDFQLIVNGFTNLESLEVDGASELNIEDFKYLRDHQNKLRVVSLAGAYWRIRQHIDELTAMFQDVRVDDFDFHRLKIKI